MGAGATRGVSAVKWGVAGNIVAAWLLTLPAAALVCGRCSITRFLDLLAPTAA